MTDRRNDPEFVLEQVTKWAERLRLATDSRNGWIIDARNLGISPDAIAEAAGLSSTGTVRAIIKRHAA